VHERGQTCVAPDYVLVPQERIEGFVSAYREAVQRLYPSLADNPTTPRSSTTAS